jgi:hypothetical protein
VRNAFTLLILITTALMASRILGTEESSFSSNDRSRWCTIRALVDNGSYVIGQRQFDDSGSYQDSGITTEGNWQTVDRVLHPDRHLFYSSKPPLFPTLAAGVYWVLKHTLGWSLRTHPLAVLRTTLLVVNCLPLALYLVLLGRLIDQFGRTDWARLYLMAAACFGTYVTTFAVVLNNHTVAACFVLFSLYSAFGVAPPSAARWAAAGFCAAFAAATDLPAAALLAWLGLVLFRRSPRHLLAAFIPAAAVPVAAFLLTNYLAIGRFVPAYGEFGGPWYNYAGSYWQQGAPMGIDAAGDQESKLEYAIHLLIGHHGLFSLTPVFFLALLSERPGSVPSTEPASADQTSRDKALGTILAGTWFLTLVVFSFYLIKTSNYGGGTSGPRWLFWLTPLLLLSALPTADALSQQRWTRWLGYLLLAVSIFSVQFSATRPWSDPWLYQFLSWLDGPLY